MRKETDMDGLKSLAHTLLLFEPVPTEYSPMIVKHPFTDSGIVVLKNGNDEMPQFADITEDKAAFKTWQEEMKKQIDNLSSPGQFLLTPVSNMPVLRGCLSSPPIPKAMSCETTEISQRDTATAFR